MRTENHHRIAPEGFPFIGLSLLLILIGWFIHLFLFIPLLVLGLWVVLFFRSPKRVIPEDSRSVISPADGKIIFIGEVEEERFLKTRVKKISIFMSPFNVHINRIPVDGEIKKVAYNKGKYCAAFSEKASLDNEQNAIVIEDNKRRSFLFVQIAGFLARRIVCYAKVGDQYKKGDIFGLIRFGSRVDVYMPVEVEVGVRMNQHVKGGETVLAIC